MEFYSLLRAFADSWMLLVLFCVFVGIWFWVIRPGSSRLHDEAKTMIFRNDERPAPHKEANE
ncbi:MAG: cbb3-type cytochrome c oxidase subunit 3 [Roseobacter sp.]